MKKLRSYAFTFSAGLLISLFLAAAFSAAQDPASSGGTNVTESAAAGKDTSLIDLFKTGGPLMYPLALCSFAVIGLVVYHIMELSEKKLVPPQDLEALRHMMYQRDTANAYAYCEQNPSFITSAFGAGVLRLKQDAPDKGQASAEASMAEAVDNQETRMGFWLNMLSVIAAISPMVGLLGTVSGMIKAFQKIGLGGMGKPEQLAGNIGEALITTATGLLIGIPAMLAFFIFRGRLDGLLTRTTDALTELTDLFTGDGVARLAYEARAAAGQAQQQQFAPAGAEQSQFAQYAAGQGVQQGYAPQPGQPAPQQQPGQAGPQTPGSPQQPGAPGGSSS